MSSIVFGSANHWTSPCQVGSHAWARLFVQHEWRAAYVSDPVTPWHWLNGQNRDRIRERFSLWRKGGHASGKEMIRAWVPFSLFAPQNYPLFRSQWALENWDLFSMPPVETQLRDWEFEAPNVLWLDSVRHAGWGKRLAPALTVLRLADWNAGFTATPQSIVKMEQKLLTEADIVITSARALEDRIRPARGNRPLCAIRNGVDFAFWSSPCPEPVEYASIPCPRAIYVGAVDEWFDVPLLIKVACALKDFSFVVIGQRRIDFETEESPANIYWLGTRPRETVRSYVQHAQVGIIPFKRTGLIECVCPLKLYEYMACGLPVIATRWEELEHMKSPAKLAANAEEWITHFQNLFGRSQEMDPASHTQLRATSLAYAAANDWQERWNDWQTIYSHLA